MKTTRVLAIIGLCLAACGGDEATGGSGSTSGTGGAGGAGGGPSRVSCNGAPSELSLGGTWAAYGKLAVSLQGSPGGAISICPADQVGESTMLVMVTVTQDPADPKKIVEARATLCSIELPTVTALVGSCDPSSASLVSTQIVAPPAFIGALPDVPSAPVAGALGGAASGAAVAFDRFTLTVGANKPAPALPRWDVNAASCSSTSVGRTNACEPGCVDDCAALRDDDGEGYPGVTMHVCGYTPSDQKSGIACHADMPDDPGATLQGRAFIVMQVDPKLDGVAESSCEVSGNIDSSVLYNLIGADIYLAGSPITVTQAIQSLPSFQVDPAASKFRMVRIDGKYGAPSLGVDPVQAKAACTEIIKHVNELF